MDAVFKKIDLDGNGTLDHHEIKKAFDAVKMPITDEEIMATMNDLDNNGDGVLSLEEFKTILWKRVTAGS